MPLAFRPHRRSGLTLVEILIALTMTLIVLGTMITAFKFASEEMREGRALIELANRARLVEDQLRTDLERLTVETRVFDGIDEPDGYFEYSEGPIRDSTFSVGGGPLGTSLDTYQGDCDDVLCFTARSSDDVLFRGRRVIAGGGATVTIESSLAEVIWFTTVNGNEAGDGNFDQQVDTGGGVSNVDFDDSIQLRRRVLLIRPDLNDSTSGALATGLSNAEVNTSFAITTFRFAWYPMVETLISSQTVLRSLRSEQIDLLTTLRPFLTISILDFCKLGLPATITGHCRRSCRMSAPLI